jgi:hypothetical protein
LNASLAGDDGREFAPTPLGMASTVLQGGLIDQTMAGLCQLAGHFGRSTRARAIHPAVHPLVGKAVDPLAEGGIGKMPRVGDRVETLPFDDVAYGLGTAAAPSFLRLFYGDFHSDRTSATTFLANAMRLLLACAAYALHHAWRTHTLQHTALAQAQPATIILTLFKIATQVKQYKERLLLHLPSSCPVKALLQRVTTLLCAVPVPVGNTS